MPVILSMVGISSRSKGPVARRRKASSRIPRDQEAQDPTLRYPNRSVGEISGPYGYTPGFNYCLFSVGEGIA